MHTLRGEDLSFKSSNLNVSHEIKVQCIQSRQKKKLLKLNEELKASTIRLLEVQQELIQFFKM